MWYKVYNAPLTNVNPSYSGSKTGDFPHEATTGLGLLHEVARKLSVPPKTLSLYVPQHLLAVHSG